MIELIDLSLFFGPKRISIIVGVFFSGAQINDFGPAFFFYCGVSLTQEEGYCEG